MSLSIIVVIWTGKAERIRLSNLTIFSSYLALASTAKQYDLVRPELTEEAVLQVEDGRHLLVELVCQSQFIPNDCNLSDPSMMILTGANSSGKSIYLKQMGIITYLAHIGRYVLQ